MLRRRARRPRPADPAPPAYLPRSPVFPDPAQEAMVRRVVQLLQDQPPALPAWEPGTTAGTGERAPGTDLIPVPRYDIARHQRIVKVRRARGLPWRIGAATVVPGHAGWGVGLAADAIAGPTAHLAAAGVTGLGTVAVLAALRRAHQDLLGDNTRWYRAAAAGGTAYATITALLGPAALPLLALAAWTRGVSQGWLHTHRPELAAPPTDPATGAAAAPGAPGEPDSTTSPAGEGTEVSEGDDIRERLRASIFGPGGQLAGVELYQQERLDHGWRWTAQLPEGVYWSATAGCEEALAAALHTAAELVMWEPVTSDVTRAVLTITTTDLLAQGFAYPGPEYHSGRIPLGVLSDGHTRAEAVLADDAGVHCVAATGDKRMGKSTVLAGVLLGLLESGKWITLFADGDATRGSNPALASRAYWPVAGPERVLAQLCALEGILEARQHAMPTLTRDPETGLVVPMTRPGQERVDKLLPGDAGFPGVCWLFDEFHALIDDPMLLDANFPERLLAVLLLGAKYAICAAAATHSVHRAHWWDMRLFAAFAGRNHFAFYSHSTSEYVQAGEDRIPLCGLPTTGGYFLAPSTGRLLKGRTAFPVTAGDRVFTHPQLHELDLLGAGHHWPTEERDPAADYLEAVEQLAGWQQAAQARLQDDAPAEDQEEPEDFSGYGDVVPLRLAPAASSGALEIPADLNPTRAAILAVLRDLGSATNKQLHNQVPGVAPSDMTKHLNRLAEQGLARKARHGQWEPVAPPATGTGS